MTIHISPRNGQGNSPGSSPESSKGKMSKLPIKGALMLLFSIGTGAAGVYLSQQYVEKQLAQKSALLVPDVIPMRDVVVPTRNLLRGEMVFSEDLSIREFPADYVDSNSVSVDNYDLAVGQRMDFDIDEGRPLLWAHLASGEAPTFSGKVEQGLRAMTVRVDDINSISGFLQPGDKVDLLLSYGDDESRRILPLMNQLNVIATGVQTEADKLVDDTPRSFSTITVHVKPADAQKLTLAQQVGQLTAILRHPDDVAVVSEPSLSVTQLMDSIEGTKPVKRAKRVVKLAAKVPSIEYIIGGQL